MKVLQSIWIDEGYNSFVLNNMSFVSKTRLLISSARVHDYLNNINFISKSQFKFKNIFDGEMEKLENSICIPTGILGGGGSPI